MILSLGNPLKMAKQSIPAGNSSKMAVASNASLPRRILGDRTNVHGQKSVAFSQSTLKAGPSKKLQPTRLPSPKGQKRSLIPKSAMKTSNFKIFTDQPQISQKAKVKTTKSKTLKMPAEKEYMPPGDDKGMLYFYLEWCQSH